MLRGSGQAGVIVYEYGNVEVPELLVDKASQRHVPPAEVGGMMEMPIFSTNSTRNGHTDCDDARSIAQPCEQRPGKALELIHDLDRIRVGQRAIAPRRADDRAPEADDRSADPVGR